ncbi:ATP-dependent 6-phosphofructokinase [Zancudomyces culisetae]|uniref:6-phosphofructokinase n=1 Tax=Zancudomyces culisetae TaxID=1213189 RepID=A0A1R1PSJ0_ZANCU|nr:ATP-dependent 6-phosphofructokinase [Zancudomyces culisetae]|eukprot:OMH83955.1 ATP-dependent 6-phosphofructokinase [Zancudomyces culisetae]
MERRESYFFVYPKQRWSAKDATFEHLTIACNNQNEYEQVLKFYELLNFVVIRKAAYKEGKKDLGDPNQTILGEVWLHQFSRVNNSALTLRVVLIEDIDGENEKKKIVEKNVSLSFYFEDVMKLHEELKEQKVEHEIYVNEENGKKRLTLFDPVGTRVYVVPEVNAFNVPVAMEGDFEKSYFVDIPRVRADSRRGSAAPSGTSTPAIQYGTKRIGILTSGGDAQGMNAAVRSIVRYSIQRGLEPFLIYDGYSGLVQGGSKIVQAKWSDVSGFLTHGGTLIGTARCLEFREKEGRRIGAKTLIKNGISSLVVIGGDGSLTGADVLRAEWPEHIDALLESGEITAQEARENRHLMIAGMVGSIDNDLASTDVTIGANSALTRICESVDALQTTAASHHRAFVVEVMGRHCGWLALSAAICTGADYLFIPEDPPKSGEWEDKLCEALKNSRDRGKKTSLVIVAEGATDSELNSIKADRIKEILSERLKYDTRVTILGHVQRGGSPTFIDRYLGTVQGAEAVEAIIRATPHTPSQVIGLLENRITTQPLQQAIELTRSVAERINTKDFKGALNLRSSSFASQLKAYKEIATFHVDGRDIVPENKRINIAIIHVGAPAGGINLATRCAVRLCINRGHTPLLVYNGFPGLMRGEIREADWMIVDSWTVDGGSHLGMNRDAPDDQLGAIAFQLQKHNVHGLIIIGGFEGYLALSTLQRNRKEYPAFSIPLVLIPATVSNNVPGTDNSIGSDTAINVIVNACDIIKQSAGSSRKRVFLLEVQGGYCGYLAVMGGLAGGASCIYTPEEGVSLQRVLDDTKYLKYCYKRELGQSQGRIVLYNERASSNYTLPVLTNIYRGEGGGLFKTNSSVLGHLQQGSTPSPLDRIHSNTMAVSAIEWIQQRAWDSIAEYEAAGDEPALSQKSTLKRKYLPRIFTNSSDSAVVVGILDSEVKFTPVADLIHQTDFIKRNRRAGREWWAFLPGLINVISRETNEQPQSFPSSLADLPGANDDSQSSISTYKSIAVELTAADLDAMSKGSKPTV